MSKFSHRLLGVWVYTSGQVGISVNEFAIMHEYKLWVKYCGTCITFRNCSFSFFTLCLNFSQRVAFHVMWSFNSILFFYHKKGPLSPRKCCILSLRVMWTMCEEWFKIWTQNPFKNEQRKGNVTSLSRQPVLQYWKFVNRLNSCDLRPTIDLWLGGWILTKNLFTNRPKID